MNENTKRNRDKLLINELNILNLIFLKFFNNNYDLSLGKLITSYSEVRFRLDEEYEEKGGSFYKYNGLNFMLFKILDNFYDKSLKRILKMEKFNYIKKVKMFYEILVDATFIYEVLNKSDVNSLEWLSNVTSLYCYEEKELELGEKVSLNLVLELVEFKSPEFAMEYMDKHLKKEKLYNK